MSVLLCAHVFPSGNRCWAGPHEHVHTPPPCANGADRRHHKFVPDQSHEHEFDRCRCGAAREQVPA